MKINTWFLMLHMKIRNYLKKYNVFNGIVSKIREIDDDWLEYSKDYMKIRFSSDDDNLLLNKPLKFYNMTVTIRCVFSEENKLYPQVFLMKLYLAYKNVKT